MKGACTAPLAQVESEAEADAGLWQLPGLHEALQVHKAKHFDELIEALEKTQEMFSILVIANKLRDNPSKSGIFEYGLDERSDANVALLARAKTVELP